MPQNLKRLNRVLCCSNCLSDSKVTKVCYFYFYLLFVSFRGQNNSPFAVFLSLFLEKEIIGNYSRFRDTLPPCLSPTVIPTLNTYGSYSYGHGVGGRLRNKCAERLFSPCSSTVRI